VLVWLLAAARRPGLALVVLSVVEQRYRAVMAVLDGAAVTEAADEALLIAGWAGVALSGTLIMAAGAARPYGEAQTTQASTVSRLPPAVSLAAASHPSGPLGFVE
jgi:hypothetical protein